jgi:eukaryotic-like serine/threonine-protein kinase
LRKSARGLLDAAARLPDSPAPMWIGDVVADRFVIERPSGSGGMGSVFLATDRLDGRPVAVKVLECGESGAVERFHREARVLAELAHPAIVKYVAHGETDAREAFLVMEWVQGDSLQKRLARGRINTEDSLIVVRRLADALAHAHSRGVVHRDVKPSNVLLAGDDPRRAMLVDFGIARVTATRGRTRTGVVLGTVGYMAPEQARGESDTDARADVFALGCLLFECLTGEAAFGGPHELAILAKLLSGDAPRLADHRPELGGDLDALVARMLARDPAERLPDGGSVRTALGAIERAMPAAATDRRAPVAAGVARSDVAEPELATSPLTGSERLVRSMLFAALRPVDDSGPTMDPDAIAEEREPFDALAKRFGADRTWLPGGRLLLAFSGARSAADLAAFASTCALELHARAPAATVAVATGTAETGREVVIGPVIDRVAMLLAGVDQAQIAIDGVTADLLPGYFVVEGEGERRLLIRAVTLDEEPRPLMGRRTPCVGREREIGQLELVLDECVEEPVARAVVLVGDPGMGKTRLRQEFVARARETRPELTVIFGRGERVAAGSPLTLARHLVRSGLGLTETGENAGASHRIRTSLERTLSSLESAERRRVGDFLGELVGVVHPEEPCVQLLEGREDPRLMHDWLRRSFVAWLAALGQAGPVLVVLDDLHWADVTTVGWIHAALKTHSALPLFVLGLGRPELRDRHRAFPEQQEIPLGGLKRSAAEGLVRSALKGSSDLDVARIVEQSGGNAFYLEELIRHFASGATDLPPTVLAMAQTRFESIDTGARAVLRAASVFGERFWLEGVEAVLGEHARDARRWLELLAAEELVAMRGDSRFSDQGEYVFRHALVREAAYASLSAQDCQVTHFGAVRWLEKAGETDPLVMIDHFERASRARLAVPWYAAAAHGALASADVFGSEALARRGLATFAAGEPRDGALLVTLSSALMHRSSFEEARDVALEALERVAQGSTEWLIAVARLVASCLSIGDVTTPQPWLTRLATVADDCVPSTPLGWCLYMAYSCFMLAGERALADSAMAQFDRVHVIQAGSSGFEAWRHATRAVHADQIPENVVHGYADACEALRIFESLEQISSPGRGGSVNRHLARGVASHHASFLGDVEAALELSSSTGTTAYVRDLLATPGVYAAVARGDVAAADELAAPALGSASVYTRTCIGVLLAVGYADEGRHAAAERVIAELPPGVAALRGLHAGLHMAKARAALARDDAERALAECELGDIAATERGALAHARHLLVLTRAEALMRLRRDDDARATLAELRSEVDAVAAKLDEAARAKFLARGYPAARIVKLCADWFDPRT